MDAILRASQPALFATAGGECIAFVLNKLHGQSYHVFVWQESEQLASEATVPDSAISRCQICKHGTSHSLLQNIYQYCECKTTNKVILLE